MGRFFGWLIVWGLVVGCRRETILPSVVTPTPPPVRLRIGLSSSAGLVAGLVTEPYREQTDRGIVQFISGNQAALFSDLENGQLDAILVHHIPEDDAYWFNPVALDGLVVITHPENPVTELSRGEVQGIFNGRIVNWSAVGGTDQPITLISREPGSGTRAEFQERIMAEQRININAQIAADDTAVQQIVAADPTAIGYSMMGSAKWG